MSELRTEEEQLEVMKKWWADNGKAIIVALVLSISAIAGWKWWQAQQQAKAEAASSAYEQLMDVMSKPELTEEERATAKHLAVSLQADHEETLYANYAALFEARLLLDNEQYTAAQAVLNKLQAEAVNDLVKEVAGVREAELLWQQGKNQQALDLLNQLQTQAYAGDARELKGDILVEMGDKASARQAYQQAKQAFNAAGISRPVLDMKLTDLGA